MSVYQLTFQLLRYDETIDSKVLFSTITFTTFEELEIKGNLLLIFIIILIFFQLDYIFFI